MLRQHHFAGSQPLDRLPSIIPSELGVCHTNLMSLPAAILGDIRCIECLPTVRRLHVAERLAVLRSYLADRSHMSSGTYSSPGSIASQGGGSLRDQRPVTLSVSPMGCRLAGQARSWAVDSTPVTRPIVDDPIRPWFHVDRGGLRLRSTRLEPVRRGIQWQKRYLESGTTSLTGTRR